MKRAGLVALAALCLVRMTGMASAAEVKWTYDGAVQALYSDNVYYTPDSSSAQTRSSAGGSIAANVALSSTTPRTELTAGYHPSYHYYASETGASTLQHFLALRWKGVASPNTSFILDESASYSPESSNFQGRGVDKAFTIGPRASQLRSSTGVSVISRVSPRWSLNAGYAYRLLGNGKPDLGDQDGTVVAPILYDEDGHSLEVGASYQLSPASTFSLRANGTDNRYEPDHISAAPVGTASTVVTTSSKTTSYGLSAAYGWAVAERTSFNFGLGGYRTTDRANQSSGLGSPAHTSNDLSADVGLVRTYMRGSLSLGLARGISTFDGLTRTRQVPVDPDHDGTPNSTVTVVESLGSATRTTVFSSYTYKVSNDTTLAFDLNGTLRDESSGSGRITSLGAGGSYGYRFASWGGLLASYTYTRQHASGGDSGTGGNGFAGRNLSSNSAMLGLFFGKP